MTTQKILVTDVGRDGTKVVTESLHQFLMPSRVCQGVPDYSMLNKDDIVIELEDGSCWYVGEKAALENPLSRVNFDTKVSQETLLLTLAAAWKMKYFKDFHLVFGLPYDECGDAVKQEMTNLLKGPHRIRVNGERVTITLPKPIYAIEGAGAFYNCAKQFFHKLVYVVEIGARTTHLMAFYPTPEGHRFIRSQSKVLSVGFESNHGATKEQFAYSLYQEAKRLNWDLQNGTILNAGGPAHVMEEPLKKYFPTVETPVSPRFANALGFLTMAKAALAKKGDKK